MVGRAKAGPFSDNAVELLKTFADQAVIAVENVRLFKELQARTAELTQSVEKLTALGEVSQGRQLNPRRRDGAGHDCRPCHSARRRGRLRDLRV